MTTNKIIQLKYLLETAVEQHNHTGFVANDPISIPHQYKMKEDIEIAGFFAAIMAWGKRSTAISKCKSLLDMMGHEPYRFLETASPNELNALSRFKHRTLNGDDVATLINSLRMIYLNHGGLEEVFTQGFREKDAWQALINLNKVMFGYPHLSRTRKHIPNPEKGSAAKRLNMYLRWMVRKDEKGVDFGIWSGISPAQLLCPLDVHVAKTARRIGLLERSYNDRKAVDELTCNLRLLDPTDPVRYDFALFGMSKRKLQVSSSSS